ncbi:GAF domain-containing protein [Ideonella sp. A 288]|uniref:GAF domain-containing protein n=1 Tax=Ideonella sp. A 288 TaxID=1962181 RepID=UPI000B4B4144|nr:GAF domain-containing protein [Ideonella sp. A 288]
MTDSPAFGQADLTNCERELIHLAGSVQPHGLLLVLAEPDMTVLQATANASALMGLAAPQLGGMGLDELGGDLGLQLRRLATDADLADPVPLRVHTGAGSRRRQFEGALHRLRPGRLVVELEPAAPADIATVDLPHDTLMQLVGTAVQRFSNAASIGVLADAAAQCFRDLTGHDRVMIYKFDADGHGKIIAEARDPRLDSLLGHHYPATDIPQRARELYLRNRVRVLVDVHYQPSPLQPARAPGDEHELDMSMCYLRSMSPLHLQYLKNMGVTATVVVSLVREGRLWGLVAAHHYTPRNLRLSVRAACDLLAEVVSTRIAAIENYAHAQVAVLVRRLEQRLIEATSTEGDWRLALLRNPRTLLQPLEATGAALFNDGEILTSGEVPSTPELRQLLQWVDGQNDDGLFSCSSVSKAHPALDSLTPTASGVLAVRLATARPDYLMWFRKEQLLTVTWAGDPSKPMVNDDPLELSPRRSFAAWSEIVRGTALPWTSADLALGRAIGAALVDIIVQVHAVRLLIAEHQLTGIRATVQGSGEPVVIADAQGRLLFCNDAFTRLTGRALADQSTLSEMASLFSEPAALRHALASLRAGQPPWRGETSLVRDDGNDLPVSVRAEVVPGRDGMPLGTMMMLFDMSDTKRAAAARQHLEQTMLVAAHGQRQRLASGEPTRTADAVIGAILTNASLAAMDIADGSVGTPVARLLEELEASTQRATALYSQIRDFTGPREA